MAVEIKMPQLSDTMSAGKILNWKKKEGDTISRGDILAEVETDKANLEIESFFQGTLLKILVPADQNAKVGEIIAVIGAPGEQVAASSGSAPASSPAPKTESRPAPAAAPKLAPAPAPTSYASGNAAMAVDSYSDSKIKASPLARKIAQQNNIDLSALRGSGPNGRIIKKDIEQARGGSATPQSVPQAPQTARSSTPPAPVGSGSLTPLSKMRETIARRMQESVTQSPHFYTTIAIDMEQASALREVLKEQAEYKGISINHLIIKAAAYALRNEPRVNRAMRDNQVYEPAQINIGIITAVEDGLLIPVIREADSLALRDVVFEAKAAIDRARAGRPNSSDLSGGTFSISNMGMYDVENFTAIINPGQGAVLAVSGAREEAVVKNGQLAVAKRMRATLSVDHRVIDGVMAATFLKFFKQGLEIPALLMA